ncbi:MAG: TetR/AcrR family transcriptional regulator [Actinomycetota bacterium]
MGATTATAAADRGSGGAGCDAATATDGRAARRQRNITAVLDVAVAMFTEGELFPTVEQVSKRSGVSVRSIYRYFPEPADLHEAAIGRHRERTEPLAHLPSIGQGSLADRIDDFVAMRLRLHDGVGATYRATVHNAPNQPRLEEQLARARADLRRQLERQFAPELGELAVADQAAVATASDVLTQLDSIELLRHHRMLSVADTEQTLRLGLRRLLGDPR